MSQSPADTARWWNDQDWKHRDAAMTTFHSTDRTARRAALLNDLLRQKGIRRYGLFGVTAEGKPLPDGSESASGFVLDEQGHVFSFWLDWDEGRQRVGFTDWQPVEPEADWDEDEEYRAARRAAGLS